MPKELFVKFAWYNAALPPSQCLFGSHLFDDGILVTQDAVAVSHAVPILACVHVHCCCCMQCPARTVPQLLLCTQGEAANVCVFYKRSKARC